jgi:hypothetical protein
MGRRRSASAAALVVALLLTGCSSSITSGLAQSVSQSLSAAQTARTALAQSHDGRLIDGVGTTAFEDMLREAQGAEASAQAASPPTAAQGAERNRVLALLHDTTSAVVAAQDAAEQVPGASSPTTAVRRLSTVIQRLQATSRRLGSGR